MRLRRTNKQNNKFMRQQLILITLIISLFSTVQGQDKTIDGIAAVVGESIILQSEVESQYLQFRMQGNFRGSDRTKCDILQNLVTQKILLRQAKQVDSLTVTDQQIEANLNQRMRYFINQMGSEKKLESYFNKKIPAIKDELRGKIEEQMLVQKEQQQITQNMNITPSEVRDFYKSIPPDSIPKVETQYVIGEIVKKPPISPKELNKTRKRLKELKQRIEDGKSFSTLAVLYSQDDETAKNGGELGFYSRGELNPEFAAVAYNLEKGEVSDIVRDKDGFHLIQLIERRGELINVRHILLKPKPSTQNIQEAQNKLDSIATLVRKNKMSFSEAAKKFSDSPNAINGGIMVNPKTNNKLFKASDLDPNVSYAVKNMQEGEISDPIPTTTKDGTKAYRIIYLKEKNKPHKANLDQDYNTIKEWALQQKKSKKLRNWIKEKMNQTYIRVNEPYKDCNISRNMEEAVEQFSQ
ncbi:MAG: peptidylprolyl isomerase [Bacteroidales bacterium]|nr:peptidylprolyl isomerase [Bacteroidales bacterium]MCF8333247.1 peptidylprolyl isomerase [Bacteroidales bacterium]